MYIYVTEMTSLEKEEDDFIFVNANTGKKIEYLINFLLHCFIFFLFSLFLFTSKEKKNDE